MLQPNPALITAVVAEKPAVARDLARVLGATRRAEGYLFGNGFVVTWAFGHLVALAEPHEIRPAWRRWSPDELPMLPQTWPLTVCAETREQFEIVRKILTADKVKEVICATDAGREGELIFRYIYQAASCRKTVRRLWLSSLTEEAIRKGFAHLREGRDFDALASAARGRSQADWLVGMNLSRAFTLACAGPTGEPLSGETLSVGRVQTPTLAMVVERELAIRAFVPEPYLEVTATFSVVPWPEQPVPAETPSEPSSATSVAARAVESPRTYRGTYFRGATATPENRRLPADFAAAEEIVRRAQSGTAEIASVRGETRRLPPPLLYDLTELQRHANRLFGFSAKKTLELAQKLYETYKLISYPRTDSRYLSQDVAATLSEIVSVMAGPYRDQLAAGTGERPLGRRFVDDAQVSDHHAIIPTAHSAVERTVSQLSADEHRIYDLICRRLLMAWHTDHVTAVTKVITQVSSRGPEEAAPVVDTYASSGTAVEQEGWKVLDLALPKSQRQRLPASADPAARLASESSEQSADQSLPPGLAAGQKPAVVAAEVLTKETRPPQRLTEATLLTAMETAGKTLDDKELSEAMRESGLGTPATRAETIETLLKRQYIERQGKTLWATDKGIRLIERVDERVKSPAMTGEWEAKLKQIERGRGDLATFMSGIEAYVRDVVSSVLAGAAQPRPAPSARPHEPGSAPVLAPSPLGAPPPGTPPPGAPPPGTPPPGAPPPRPMVPADPARLGQVLRERFGLEQFRPYQEAVCQAVIRGDNVLLVMPTGAGKSLCYQLPGLVRGGTTLVISPLIALMEDQVAKLRELGLRAERIHSGRERGAFRQVQAQYLQGELDYLLIAPERLSVPGFPELLAKRRPTLIAVDEAHCISHWGHDFRPDYRLLNQRLPLLQPAPVIALTATATPQVQDDITAQLGIQGATRFIHGFRRTNIAVEVAEARPSERQDIVLRLLRQTQNRPAIVYAPTRKQAEALGAELRRYLPAATYHAGMTAAERDRVQAAFLEGRLEAIVATIAFGMGIDKPDIRTVIHTGLPGSVEGYYQEIGRAGRDGKPARAILLYSYADRRTHEFFHARDYPEAGVLTQIWKALGPEPQPMFRLARQLGLDPELWEKALEKLWIHGGAEIDPEENVRRGSATWQATYPEQSAHKLAQLASITRFAQVPSCRMLQLVRHFGDQEDSGALCGQCDICAPQTCIVRGFRPLLPAESEAVRRILQLLQQSGGQGTGKVFQATCAQDHLLDRDGFARVLGGLARADLVRIEESVFTKDGREIHFQRAFLTPAGRQEDALERPIALALEPEAPAKRRKKAGASAGKKSQRPGALRPRRSPAEAAGSPSAGARSAGARSAGARSAGARSAGSPSAGARSAASPSAGSPSAGSPSAGARSAPATTTHLELDAGAVRPPLQDLVAALKTWRLAEAKKRRIPAFYVMSDRTLAAIAAAQPRDESALLAIKGIGPALVRKYGQAVLAIVGQS